MNNSVILIVSATKAECEPTLKKMTERKIISPCLFSGSLNQQKIELLIGGIGSVATTFNLTQTLMQRKYNRAISIGIAGSFEDEIRIGDAVQITEDCFADLGVDDNGRFISLRQAGLDSECDLMINPSPASTHHRQLRGITVQTASGSMRRIDELVRRHSPKVETMENAAFFYVCRKFQIPFASFRAISNKVEPRNREKWRTEIAIERVNSLLQEELRPV